MKSAFDEQPNGYEAHYIAVRLLVKPHVVAAIRLKPSFTPAGYVR